MGDAPRQHPQGLELLAPKGLLLHATLGGLVPEHQHNSDDQIGGVADGSGQNVHQPLGAVRPHQHGTGPRPRGLAAADHPLHRVWPGGMVAFGADPVDLVQGEALGLLPAPAREALGLRVHQGDESGGVGGDDPIGDGLEGGEELLLFLEEGRRGPASGADVSGQALHGHHRPAGVANRALGKENPALLSPVEGEAQLRAGGHQPAADVQPEQVEALGIPGPQQLVDGVGTREDALGGDPEEPLCRGGDLGDAAIGYRVAEVDVTQLGPQRLEVLEPSLGLDRTSLGAREGRLQLLTWWGRGHGVLREGRVVPEFPACTFGCRPVNPPAGTGLRSRAHRPFRACSPWS